MNDEIIFNKLLETNIISKKLNENREYKVKLIQFDFGFYLLKRSISADKLKVLMKCERLISNMELMENYEFFKEGTRYAGLK